MGRSKQKPDRNSTFAAPYHSWERGTSENTNGLIRQYLAKRTSMAHITQHACNRIAHKLNTDLVNDSASSPPRIVMNSGSTT